MTEAAHSSRLVLASGSPRRLSLLAAAGFHADVLVPDCDESRAAEENVDDYVLRMANIKCQAGIAAAKARWPEERLVVVAADTVVVAPDGRIFGKPENIAEGGAMLACLMAAKHYVISAFCVGADGDFHAQLCRSEVTMRAISAAEAADYWASGEPIDKAGGYAIQGYGGVFVTGIDGSYTNIVGLPIQECAGVLNKVGLFASWQQEGSVNG